VIWSENGSPNPPCALWNSSLLVYDFRVILVLPRYCSSALFLPLVSCSIRVFLWCLFGLDDALLRDVQVHQVIWINSSHASSSKHFSDFGDFFVFLTMIWFFRSLGRIWAMIFHSMLTNSFVMVCAIFGNESWWFGSDFVDSCARSSCVFFVLERSVPLFVEVSLSVSPGSFARKLLLQYS
jgi:hypothetical protein